jgi:hypothetical protein
VDADKSLSALWGKFACDILLAQDWDVALDDLNALKELIDSQEKVLPLQQLQQRTWLIHWSLFVFFNHPKVSLVVFPAYFRAEMESSICFCISPTTAMLFKPFAHTSSDTSRLLLSRTSVAEVF